jgi:hypothetical protein
MVNGGNNVDDWEDTHDVVEPTCKEALTATFTLRRYIADINEPFAHNLKDILANFGHQTRLEEVHGPQDGSNLYSKLLTTSLITGLYLVISYFYIVIMYIQCTGATL